jgi:hypothetical protein
MRLCLQYRPDDGSIKIMIAREQQYLSAIRDARNIESRFDSAREFIMGAHSSIIVDGLTVDADIPAPWPFGSLRKLRLTSQNVKGALKPLWDKHPHAPKRDELVVVTGRGALHIYDESFNEAYTEFLNNDAAVVGTVSDIEVLSYDEEGIFTLFDTLKRSRQTVGRESLRAAPSQDEIAAIEAAYNELPAERHRIELGLLLSINAPMKKRRKGGQFDAIEGTVYVPLQHKGLIVTPLGDGRT